MLINFHIENFGAIKDKQTLSFEADKSNHLEDTYIIPAHGLRLLKLGLIYGANASGKTTILKALEFLRLLVLEPKEKKTEIFDFEPFLFTPTAQNGEHTRSKLSIEFLQNDVRYFYSVTLSKSAIVEEALDFYDPKKANVFKRTTDLKEQYTTIKFGSKIKEDAATRKHLESNTLWNNTVLGGFLKTNANIHELKEVTNWFNDYLKPLVHTKTQLRAFVTSLIQEATVPKSDVLSILQKADFNISDIIIQEEEAAFPDGLLDFLSERLSSNDSELAETIKATGKLKKVNLKFQHTVDGISYQLPFHAESDGTQRYYGFAGLLSLLIKNAVLFPIDELESSLHPELFTHFLLAFLANSQQSQILATTHNRELLNNRDIFRDDAIWITDKDEKSATQLYSLADFDSSVIRNTTNRLNAYQSGRLGGVPNLGDFFINVN